MKPRPRDPRNRHRSGQTLLELGFVFLPTFAMLFAFIDFGMAIFVLTTLQNAVREGCRYAITYQTGFGGGTGQDASIRNVVASYSMGFASATASAPAQIVINYYDQYGTGGLTTPVSPAVANSNGNGYVVEVVVQNVQWRYIAPLSGSFIAPLRSNTPLAIRVASYDVMGGYPAGVTSVAR